jgi:hypothetical protein
MPAHNERFGATAAGSADLKGSGEKPPLRQAAIPLRASIESVPKKQPNLKRKYNSTTQWKKTE